MSKRMYSFVEDVHPSEHYPSPWPYRVAPPRLFIETKPRHRMTAMEPSPTFVCILISRLSRPRCSCGKSNKRIRKGHAGERTEHSRDRHLRVRMTPVKHHRAAFENILQRR